MLKLLPVRSVVDFGCGRGTWLKACLENGVETVLGLDGDYVNRDKLADRSGAISGPLICDGRSAWSGGLTWPCAWKSPSTCRARSALALVESLTAAAPVVLFSAALPGQGGTSHINEQWPPYWERLFAEQGMRKYDVVRPLIWSDKSIEWWYRQNIYIYSHNSLCGLGSLEHFEPEFSLVWNKVR